LPQLLNYRQVIFADRPQPHSLSHATMMPRTVDTCRMVTGDAGSAGRLGFEVSPSSAPASPMTGRLAGSDLVMAIRSG
jgi:hypothetical protein